MSPRRRLGGADDQDARAFPARPSEPTGRDVGTSTGIGSRPVGAGDRTRAAILEAAADLIAERGGEVSMNDLAAAAGVGRATLYRYFPARESLVEALFLAALGELRSRLEGASLDVVPFEEGVARAARAFMAVGSRYLVLVREEAHVKELEVCEHEVAEMGERLSALMRRGVEEGKVRPGISVEWLVSAFGSLVHAALEYAPEHGVGPEDAAALVTSQFLAGARA